MAVKVGAVQMPNVQEVKKNVDKTNDKEFKFTLLGKIEEQELMQKLESLMDDITTQGKKIADHMDIKDMKQYRMMVTEFLNEIVSRSHQFSRENFLDKRGRHRVYGIVKLVNKNLDDLAKELISSEKKHLNILGKVDEIRGLLLDIVT